MNILIVDDNLTLTEYLEMTIKESEIVQSLKKDIRIYKTSSFSDSVELSLKVTFDIFLIDIHLNSTKTGYDLALELRSNPLYKLSHIIFITANPTLENQAFRNIHCYHYLVKPFSADDLIYTLMPLIEFGKEKEEAKLMIKCDDITIIVPFSEVLYIEAMGRKTLIGTVNEEIIARNQTLKELSNKLLINENPKFIQCHKSFVINKNYVESFSISKFHIKLKNSGKYIPIGKKYKDDFLEFFIE